MFRLNCVLIDLGIIRGLPPAVRREASMLPDRLNIIPRFFLNVLLLLRQRLFL